MLRPILFACIAATAIACSSNDDDGGQNRPVDPDPGPVDPNGGRDAKPESCFAACQNSGFTCQAKGTSSSVVTKVSFLLTDRGCEGTVSEPSAGGDTGREMKLNCLDAEACVAASVGQEATGCVSALFSATSFSYAASGGANTVCVRD